jgi:opacity protein-like surface antigen
MFNVSRPRLIQSLALCLSAALAVPALRAQSVSGNAALDRHLARLDLGISGIGSFTKDVTGTNYLGVSLTQRSSNTVGALVQLRYTKSPLVGFELNYAYARYTQNFSSYVTAGAQANANEYTLGYVIHPARQFAGIQTFVSAGMGSTAFRPTPNGGEGLPAQARMTYYYSVGGEKIVFGDHFGLRAQIRETFFKAPDFGQNYLTIQQQTHTFEPGAGFFLRF